MLMAIHFLISLLTTSANNRTNEIEIPVLSAIPRNRIKSKELIAWNCFSTYHCAQFDK